MSLPLLSVVFLEWNYEIYEMTYLLHDLLNQKSPLGFGMDINDSKWIRSHSGKQDTE